MRSRFRMRFMALPMALILALVLLPACSSDGNDDDANTNVGAPVVATQAPTAASKTAPKAAPAPTKAAPVAKKPVTDELIIGALLPSLVSNNIGRGLGPQSQIQLAAMYEYLIGTDPATGALVPQLATEWAIEPNGIDIRVKLRPDIRFHDGSVITFGGNNDVSIAEFHHGEGDEGTHATLKLLDGAFHAIVANLLDTRRKMDFKVQTPLGVIGVRGTRFWG